jgi:hypothetical protein
MTLVRLPLRQGEAFAEPRQVEGVEIYLCAKDRCPHYRGQLGLLGGTAAMICALVNYPPDRTCQAYYLEAAEALDRLHRRPWQQRLEEAEAFEKAVNAATTAANLSTAEPATHEGVPPLPGEGCAMGEGARG